MRQIPFAKSIWLWRVVIMGIQAVGAIQLNATNELYSMMAVTFLLSCSSTYVTCVVYCILFNIVLIWLHVAWSWYCTDNDDDGSDAHSAILSSSLYRWPVIFTLSENSIVVYLLIHKLVIQSTGKQSWRLCLWYDLWLLLSALKMIVGHWK